MSIASEISRLQGAKSSIKTAIENKGVTVGSSLKLDDYACCIDSISSGFGGKDAIVDSTIISTGGDKYISTVGVGDEDSLLIGIGTGEAPSGINKLIKTESGGCVCLYYPVDGSYGITTALGGTVTTGTINGKSHYIHTFTESGSFYPQKTTGGKCIKYLVVGGGGAGWRGTQYGGGGGGGAVCIGYTKIQGNNYNIVVGSGGIKSSTNHNPGTSGTASCLGNLIVAKGGCLGSGQVGGNSGSGMVGCGGGYIAGGGGGGATGAGSYATNCNVGGVGGKGLLGYGGGGGGHSRYASGTGTDGGGNDGCDASNCGGGGGGGSNTAGNGGNGVVDICYASDGSYGINSATGGNCCYTCNGYCVHRFTSNGTFTIVS